MTISSVFIPLLSTNAGMCLTTANWQDLGVNLVAYQLDALLMKPGYSFLMNGVDLVSYLGWHGEVVIDASMLRLDKTGRYSIRSVYDGSTDYYSIDEIIALIMHLNPKMILLPVTQPDSWQSLPDSIIAIISSEQHGIHHFSHKGITYWSSDAPAGDACAGILYTPEGNIDLKEHDFSLNFNLLHNDCHCPTCSQGLTRAYLSHLLEHTPLLCQRYLIMHNVWSCSSFSRRDNI